jgi:hypothetical protein
VAVGGNPTSDAPADRHEKWALRHTTPRIPGIEWGVARRDREHLVQEIAIRDVLYGYSTGVDTRDWRSFRAIFLDEVEIDLSSWNGRPSARLPADDWVGGVRAGLSGFDATHHLTANHLIEIEGGTARCTSDVQASHVLDRERVILGGWYETRLARRDDGWRIAGNTLHVTWRKGPETLFAEAARRFREREATRSHQN